MSAEATRQLRLIVTYDNQAEGPSKQHHDAERARIKATAAEARKAEQDYVRAIQMRLRAEKDLERERMRGVRESAREQERINRDLNAMLRQSERDELKGVRDSEREKARAAKATFRAWKEENDARHKLAMASWREEQDAIKEQEKGVGDLVKSFINLQVVKDVAGWVKEAMQAVGQSIADAREHIKGMTDEMERARTASKEIAALRGKDATAGFTAGMAREAASAGLDVEDYKQFALGWEAYAGQYVGAEGATPAQLAKEGKKIGKDRALELQKDIGAYAVGARGLGADEGSQLLGLILAKSKAGASNDEIMSNYAQMMKVAELAPGRTAPGLGQITELGMESVGPEGDMKSVLEAAVMYRIMAQRNPNEASTYGRALFRGLRDIRKDPNKMRELGIEKGMGYRQQVEAIDKAVRAPTAGGGDQGEFLSKYFKDIREWGAIQTALNEGIRGGAFQRAEQEAAGVDAGTVRSEIARHKRSQEGRAAMDRSNEVAAMRERAGNYVELRHIQSEVRQAQVASGDLEVPEGMIGAYMTGGYGAVYGMGSRQEQEERAGGGRVKREGLLNSRAGRRWLIEHNPEAARIERKFPSSNMNEERQRADFASRNLFNRATDEKTLADAANELKRIREIQEKKLQAAERARNQQAAPPLAPPMAHGGIR